MLVLHPSSRCDVCLEGYHGHKEPLAIACGHIFCHSCLSMLPRPLCPLCRLPFQIADVRKVHVDKTALPPVTPAVTSNDLDDVSHARRLQSSLSQVVLEGAPRAEVNELTNVVREWLASQPPDEHPDLRAAYLLLWRYMDQLTKMDVLKRRASDKESALKEQLEEELQRFQNELKEEREAAAVRYEALERRSFDEREVLLASEESLMNEKECLQKEVEEWKAKLDEVSTECARLTDELEKAKHSPRYFYLHDLNGAKTDQLAVLKEEGEEISVQVASKEAVFHLSPVPLHQSIPELPANLTSFAPLTDDIDDSTDDDRSHTGNGTSISSASCSIPIKTRSDMHRARSNSSLLSRPDPDVMSVSLPRSILDVHMASTSTSPPAAPIQYNARPVEFISHSVGRVPENALGLRADPSVFDPELREQQERHERLVLLRDVLRDPLSSSSGTPSRKTSLPDDRSRSMYPSAMSSTRTPSPSSSGTPEYPAASKPQPISVASTAAAERDRARTSSVNSQNAPPFATPAPPTPAGASPAPSIVSSLLSHATVSRDPPLHYLYSTQAPGQPRPLQPRRDSAASRSGSISKGKGSAMGYQSGIARSMRTQAETPRTS